VSNFFIPIAIALALAAIPREPLDGRYNLATGLWFDDDVSFWKTDPVFRCMHGSETDNSPKDDAISKRTFEAHTLVVHVRAPGSGKIPGCAVCL
jgi:hypothetical protein